LVSILDIPPNTYEGDCFKASSSYLFSGFTRY
jgi:hypothetical protein